MSMGGVCAARVLEAAGSASRPVPSKALAIAIGKAFVFISIIVRPAGKERGLRRNRSFRFRQLYRTQRRRPIMSIGKMCAARVFGAASSGSEQGPSNTLDFPLGKSFALISTVASPGGRGHELRCHPKSGVLAADRPSQLSELDSSLSAPCAWLSPKAVGQSSYLLP